LERVPGVQCAFIYGSFPRNPKNPKGDVEIMAVGAPDLVESDKIISNAEEELGMPIHITSFTVRELQERIKVRDALVSRALRGLKIMLIGEESLANQNPIHYNAC